MRSALASARPHVDHSAPDHAPSVAGDGVALAEVDANRARPTGSPSSGLDPWDAPSAGAGFASGGRALPHGASSPGRLPSEGAPVRRLRSLVVRPGSWAAVHLTGGVSGP